VALLIVCQNIKPEVFGRQFAKLAPDMDVRYWPGGWLNPHCGLQTIFARRYLGALGEPSTSPAGDRADLSTA
jgi:hypothetical protein